MSLVLKKRRLPRLIQGIVLLLVLLGFATVLRAQNFLYWVDRSAGQIQRSGLDGSNKTTIVTGLTTPRNIAYDSVGNKIYWSDRGTNKIQRSNIDGSNIEDVVTGIGGGLRQLAVDGTNSHVYWVDDINSPGAISAAYRANLDGTNITSLISLTNGQGIAIDVPGNRLYVSDENTGLITRANLDGSNPATIFNANTTAPEDLALNADASILYWAEGAGSVESGTTSTLVHTQLATAAFGLTGIAVSTDYVFFNRNGGNRIDRVDISNGGNPTTIASGLSGLGGIAVVPEPSTYALIAGGLALMAALAWRRLKQG